VSGAKFASWLDWLLTITSGIPLFSLMCITAVDVLGRYIFGKPLPGGFELTEMLLAVAVFASLPIVELREEHISIDLLDRLYAAHARRWRRAVVYGVCAVAMSAITWQLFSKAATIGRDAMTTAVLLIPVAPVGYFIASMCAISTLLLVAKSLQTMLSRAPARL
jgi:TRAP-type C4-dicarboxylate transport system permease small subunit